MCWLCLGCWVQFPVGADRGAFTLQTWGAQCIAIITTFWPFFLCTAQTPVSVVAGRSGCWSLAVLLLTSNCMLQLNFKVYVSCSMTGRALTG
ncbi:hypothetical protein EV421DRAFT_794451 [Armillaria borealis]|uniref:Uncharacterized protein n=1 Tax=Armillaria borealis TaxID=47425 RepID=A0AA39MN19_9AGAR|nr:hypothetical protein EV421DRAFT_794451 [Armillaria borealis]